ncbi:MAG: nuclear transport factor 2 family protein [Gemmatimonadales bacterium]
MTRAIAVAALLAVAVPSSAFAQCSDADKAALMAFDKTWGDATVRGDRDFLANVIADNFMGVNLVGTVDKATTIANAVRNAELARANPQAPAVADRFVITCTPNSATITHRNVIPVPAGSMAGPTYSRSVHFLEKRGNRWQAVSSTGQPVSEQQQLVYMEMDWNDAAKNHDGAWSERNYAPFASDISSRTGAIENKVQAVESAKTNKRTFDLLELSELNTRVEGDAAVVTGVNHVKGKDAAGKAFDQRVRFTDTYIKRDGRWQVWATQGTEIR